MGFKFIHILKNCVFYLCYNYKLIKLTLQQTLYIIFIITYFIYINKFSFFQNILTTLFYQGSTRINSNCTPNGALVLDAVLFLLGTSSSKVLIGSINTQA